jgi:2-methylcitrate dehydratase PrpD
VEKHVEHAIGSLERPMTTESLQQKFKGQALTALPEAQIDRIMAMCWDIGSSKDVRELARATVPA